MTKPEPAHYIHPYAAKFASDVVRRAILDYSKEGELVLDPMAGSGTVALEAALLKRRAIALDLDPLAVLIARAKTIPLNGHAVEPLLDLAERLPETARPWTSDLLDIDFWFDRETARMLSGIREALTSIKSPALKVLGATAMSSMIVAKGTGSVANARDVAHSRAHRYTIPREVPPNVKEIWSRRVRKLVRILRELDIAPRFIPMIALADARRLPITDGAVDLVVTSPPYFNAIDYPRAHKFSLAWLEGLFESLNVDYGSVSAELIGTVRAVVVETVSEANEGWTRGSPSAERTLGALEGRLKRAMKRYVIDMGEAIGEMARVLRPGGRAFVVVGDSRVGGVLVSNHMFVVEMARSCHLEARIVGHRDIDPRWRQMPIKGGLSGRMKREELILLRKP